MQEKDQKQSNKCGKTNSSNDNIHTASGIAQDKKVCIWALSRWGCSKSKLHSPPQADHNWKPINAIAMRLRKQMRAGTVSVLKLVPNIEIFGWAMERHFI